MTLKKYYDANGQRNGVCQHCGFNFLNYDNLVLHWQTKHSKLYYRFLDEKDPRGMELSTAKQVITYVFKVTTRLYKTFKTRLVGNKS